jgi:NDP-sugar pyrophosphorylase family protein
MKKEKIAISIDKPTREMVDAMVDGLTMRSRSQAIEFLITKGIEHQYVRDAVILCRGDDADLLLAVIDRKPLLTHHLTWLKAHGVQQITLVVGKTQQLQRIQQIAQESGARVIVDERERGTLPALLLVRHGLARNFIVLLGDTLNEFDLTKMILFHLKNDKLATIGLISSPTPQKYSTVELEGDRIVEFRRRDSRSHIIDAGIYIFKPGIFKHCKQGMRFLERDVLPRLCHTNEVKGYFTHGRYVHLGERRER